MQQLLYHHKDHYPKSVRCIAVLFAIIAQLHYCITKVRICDTVLRHRTIHKIYTSVNENRKIESHSVQHSQCF